MKSPITDFSSHADLLQAAIVKGTELQAELLELRAEMLRVTSDMLRISGAIDAILTIPVALVELPRKPDRVAAVVGRTPLRTESLRFRQWERQGRTLRPPRKIHEPLINQLGINARCRI
jgi:hypothetical protein